MRFKRTLCGITAALTVFSSIAVVAQAEEAEQLKLLTAKFNEANGEHALVNYDGGYYAPDGKGVDKSKILHIGEKELAKWRETGKFTYTDIETDFDSNGFEYNSGNFEGEYVQFCKKDAAGNVTERQVVHLDKSTGKISKAYTLPADGGYTRENGYSVIFKESGSELSVSVYNPLGEKTTKTLKYTGSDKLTWNARNLPNSEDLGIVWFISKPAVTVKNGDKSVKAAPFEIYTIKKNGDLELTYSKEEPCVRCALGNAYDNCFFVLESETGEESFFVYSTEQKKKYPINTNIKGSNDSGSSWTFTSRALGSKLYGNKVIIRGAYELSENNNPPVGSCILANLRDNGDTEVVSKIYKSMSTKDGEIFLVQTLNGKRGFIDSNGKELALFDDASDFDGDYAPVVKDGKAYLIDRNMNKVSEAIDGKGVNTLSDGLYRVAVDDNSTLLVTYANNSDEPTSEPTSETSSEPVSSEPVSSETSGEPTSKPTGSTDKPAPTGAAALIPVALIGGAAVVVSSKKRRK